MSDLERGVISRRALVEAAAWSAPVIALAVAAPLASASTTPQLTYRVSGPTDNNGITSYVIWITNDGTTALAAGDLIADLPATEPDYFYSGYSGDVAWRYGDGGESVVWFFAAPIEPGAESGAFIIYLGRQGPEQSSPPTAVITFSAPGRGSVSIPLTLL